MILATFISHLIDMNYYIYVILSNVLGYSLLASLPMIYVFWFTPRRYCWFTKLSCLALPIMNIICIIGAFVGYEDYVYIFDLSIITITTALSIIFTTQKR